MRGLDAAHSCLPTPPLLICLLLMAACWLRLCLYHMPAAHGRLLAPPVPICLLLMAACQPLPCSFACRSWPPADPAPARIPAAHGRLLAPPVTMCLPLMAAYRLHP